MENDSIQVHLFYEVSNIDTIINGVNLGRTAWVNKKGKSEIRGSALRMHEATHWLQQKRHGFGLFYGRTAVNYVKAIIDWDLNQVYNPNYNTPCLNYETEANKLEAMYENFRIKHYKKYGN